MNVSAKIIGKMEQTNRLTPGKSGKLTILMDGPEKAILIIKETGKVTQWRKRQ